MKLTRKTIISLLFLLIIINITFRYPTSGHEIGVDSFAIHSYANSITKYGYDRKIASPLSLFGLYPYSSPTGALFTLSGLSQLTNLDTEHSILVLITIFGILGGIGTYLFAKEILNNHIFAFSAGILYSLSRTYLQFTTWTYSTRGPLVAILPILMFLFLKTYKDSANRTKYGVLFFIMTVILISIHRMSFFLIFIFIAFGASVVVFKGISNIKKRITFSKKSAVASYTITTSIIVFLFITPISFWAFYAEGTTKEALAHGGRYFIGWNNIISNLLNMGILYSMSFGILIILAPIGYFYNIKKVGNSFPNLFLISVLFLFPFFWTDWIYAMTFFILYVIVFASMGLIELIKLMDKKLKKKYIVVIGTIVLLLFSTSLPAVVVIEHGLKTKINTTKLKEETYNSGLYFRYYNDGLIFSNDESITHKINAFSETNPHKVPNYFHSSQMKTFSFNEIISGKYDHLYKVNKRYATLPYSVFQSKEGCFDQTVHGALEYHLQGDKKYYVCVMSYLGNNVTFKDPTTFDYIKIESPFLVDLQEKTYKIYDDGFEHVMFLNYPSITAKTMEV